MQIIKFINQAAQQLTHDCQDGTCPNFVDYNNGVHIVNLGSAKFVTTVSSLGCYANIVAEFPRNNMKITVDFDLTHGVKIVNSSFVSYKDERCAKYYIEYMTKLRQDIVDGEEEDLDPRQVFANAVMQFAFGILEKMNTV